MQLYNIWANGQHSKTTLQARTTEDALDLFCIHHGYASYLDYLWWCVRDGLVSPSPLNIETVQPTH